MNRVVSWGQLGYIGSLCAVAVVAGMGLVGRGMEPWPWVLAVAVAVAALAGPVRWLVRSRVLPDQRERYRYAAYIGFGLAVPAVVAALLLAGSVLYRADILVLGGLIGTAVVALSERVAWIKQ